MSEPTAAAPADERPVDQLTPEEAGAEVRQIRGNREHDFQHEGRPGFDAALERVTRLSERAHASADQEGPLGAAPANDPAQSQVLPDPYADPTAAVLDAVPLPEGLDPEKNEVINRVAEREGVTQFVLEGRRVIAGAASGPLVDAVTAERQLQQRWGRSFPSKLEAAHVALDLLPPGVRADLERRDLDIHPAVLDYLARVGEALMDPRTPGGERRLRARYADRTGN